MEKYFNKYRNIVDNQAIEPKTSVGEFMQRLKSEEKCYDDRPIRARVTFRTRALVCGFIGIAAAVLLAVLLPWNVSDVDPIEIYVSNYHNSVAPLLTEVREMEKESEVCRGMELSSVMEDLIDSSNSFADDLEGIDEEQKLDTVRKYCDNQLNCIRELFRECCVAYALGMPDMNETI